MFLTGCWRVSGRRRFVTRITAPETRPTFGGPGCRRLGVEVLTDLHVNLAAAPLISSLSQVSREAPCGVASFMIVTC